MVLTSSANAVVPKKGSEAYDTSKAALNHLDPRTCHQTRPHRSRQRHRSRHRCRWFHHVSARSRDAITAKIQNRYSPSPNPPKSCATNLLSFYAQRTLTKRPITPEICAAAIVWLASEQSARTTGHVIPVDGGLPEAFLR